LTSPEPSRPSGTSPQTPTWLTEPCPSWCARDHHEHDHPEDRYHQSLPSVVPAVAGSAVNVPVTSSLQALDLVIRLGRYVGEATDWLVIEAAEQREPRLVITADSARLLVHHVAGQLRRLGDAG
jgi:hypothetical protein